LSTKSKAGFLSKPLKSGKVIEKSAEHKQKSGQDLGQEG
jgi:hypothetical protein